MDASPDMIVVREFIQRELETINAYQTMLARTSTPEVRRMLAHAMEEEKEHVAEGMALLARLDGVQAAAIAADHSAHFAPGGKGDLALRAIESGGAPSADPPETTAARSIAEPTTTERPGVDLVRFTVGSLRGRAQ